MEQSGAGWRQTSSIPIDEALIQRKTAKLSEGDESPPERHRAPPVRFLLQALGGASVGNPGGAFRFLPPSRESGSSNKGGGNIAL